MSGFTSKVRAFAELGRISNLPTTLSNVMVGVAIGAYGAVEPVESGMLWTSIAMAWPAIACFYIAGMAMNDLADARIDLTERPGRPIPSGRVSPLAAMVFILVLLAAGLAALAFINRTALIAGALLVTVILLYNMVHARWTASVLLLGAARAGVYSVGAAAIAPDLNWERFEIFAITIGLYTAGFSLIARREMQPHHKPLRAMAVLLAMIPFIPLPFMFPRVPVFVIITIGSLYFAAREYLSSPARTRNAVMWWIAAIGVIDSMYLTALDQMNLAFAAVASFFVTLLAQRRLSGT